MDIGFEQAFERCVHETMALQRGQSVESGRDHSDGKVPALFAARVTGVLRRFVDDLNPHGGAIALGHPVGVSGLRLAITSLLELKRRNAERALISACVGGGQGVAMIVERK